MKDCGLRDSQFNAASASRPFSIDAILGEVPILLIRCVDASRPIPPSRDLLRLVVKDYIAASLADGLVEGEIERLIKLGLLTSVCNGKAVRMTRP